MLRHTTILAVLTFSAVLPTVAEEPPQLRTDVQVAPGSWWPLPEAGSMVKGGYPLCPDSVVSNGAGVNVTSTLPIVGYPMRPAAVVGLNDTVQLTIHFRNPTGEEYSFGTGNPETWWAPRVFARDRDIEFDPPLLDAEDLSFCVRHWSDGDTLIPKPSKIPAGHYSYVMTMDVWDLQQGFWMLVAAATDSHAKDFCAYSGAGLYEYVEAQDIRDTINAWEANFWRAIDDHDLVAAKKWVMDSILAYHRYSIPGWRLATVYYRAMDDSINVVKAYDNALQYLEKGLDRAAPDSTKRTLTQHEVAWLHNTKANLTSGRWRSIHGSEWEF